VVLSPKYPQLIAAGISSEPEDTEVKIGGTNMRSTN
jgi:hypothetical protein